MQAGRYYESILLSMAEARYPKSGKRKRDHRATDPEYDERFHHILGYRRMTDWINIRHHFLLRCRSGEDVRPQQDVYSRHQSTQCCAEPFHHAASPFSRYWSLPVPRHRPRNRIGPHSSQAASRARESASRAFAAQTDSWGSDCRPIPRILRRMRRYSIHRTLLCTALVARLFICRGWLCQNTPTASPGASRATRLHSRRFLPDSSWFLLHPIFEPYARPCGFPWRGLS